MSKIQTLRAIASGFKNTVFPTEANEALARKRALICASCPHANLNYKFIGKYIPGQKELQQVKGLGCDICGCVITAKIRQDIQACPENKW